MYWGFKPCYKWITFNIKAEERLVTLGNKKSFKPCYKWITFNIAKHYYENAEALYVLNLVINGLPSIFYLN